MLGQTINGVIIGSMYALIALGFTLIFGFLDKLNLAHGDVFMFGGFVGVFILGNSLPLWLAVIASFVICGGMGLLIEWVCFRKFKTQDAQITACLSTIALGMVITDITQRIWGTQPLNLNISPTFYDSGFNILGTRLTYVQVGIVFVSIILMVLLNVVIRRTKYGRFMRAISEDEVSTSLLGINVKRVIQQTFFISSALAGFTGLLVALRTGTASSDIGLTFGIKALAVMAIAGMNELVGALIVGLLIGILEAMAIQFGLGSISDMLVWLLLIFILILKPYGIFGKNHQGVRA